MTGPEDFCRRALPEVSRTFALNIPVLPPPLDLVVTVAYLLCRIADTLEDEARGQVSERAELFHTLGRLVKLEPGWEERAEEEFARRSVAALAPSAPSAEVQLVKGTPTVLDAMQRLPHWTHRTSRRAGDDRRDGRGDGPGSTAEPAGTPRSARHPPVLLLRRPPERSG